MKHFIKSCIVLLSVVCLQSCTKTESDFNTPSLESISISASTLNTTTGSVVTFTVLSSLNNSNVSADSKIYVNGSSITGNSFSFTTTGSFAVYATKGGLTSNVISINVASPSPNTNFKHKVLVEEYSGTWCGNCPRILYAVDLLKQQTNNAIVVSAHLFNGDPFISADGNALAVQEGISGVPSGKINRTITWAGPQDQNVNQVINNIQASSETGLAITSNTLAGNLNVTINIAYTQPLVGAAKLTVYLIEDKLTATQSNYSSNLYGGQSSIPNFQYNGVIRKAISAISGDVVPNSGATNTKDYTVSIPSNITNIANAKIIAFITNANGTVINVQEAKLGETKPFERI
jgi:Outer membrane protein Omp28